MIRWSNILHLIDLDWELGERFAAAAAAGGGGASNNNIFNPIQSKPKAMNVTATTTTTTLFRPCEPHLHHHLQSLQLISSSSSTFETTLYRHCRHTPIGLTSGSRRRRRSTTLVMATSVGNNKEEVGVVVQGKLQKGIAEFYDESSKLWEDIWGDHMHHGFYDSDVPASLSDHRSAQFRMIEETLKFAGLPVDEESDSLVKRRPKSIVDVGCGIGGSSRYIAKKYGAKCQGITLSPIQAQRAQALAVSEGLADNVSFQVADALQQPFPDGEFDLVWSMESGEHMPDKAKFVNELVRVAAPGATIIIVTWCHRNLSPSEASLKPSEKALLDKICNAYYLPDWCSTADYVRLLESHSLQDIKTADWSEYVAPFWPAVIRSALSWKGVTSLLRTGWKTIKGALAMPLMIQGFQKNIITFAIITCRKPE